jgi:rhodanese-related sulfurtransferase
VSGNAPHGAGGRSRFSRLEGRGRLDRDFARGAVGAGAGGGVAVAAVAVADLPFPLARFRERLLTLGRATWARYRDRMARKTIDELLDEARAHLRRVDPDEAHAAAARGAHLIDIRSGEQRRADGVVPGARYYPRNVLEWRLDPTSGASDPAVADPEAEIILFCNEGYASSLAAVTLQELGFARATDLAGGFQAWKAAGLRTAPLDE